ncbi:3-hydroxyacyl-[acyl-carrier-protein] dehydratase FabZ [Thalassoglobus polymorphus]|uniref:3-hydroxyacyl-[acyl-carrier-protein] dehydratase FabZ n=2 Tax=Thalassoglobus polymorphus TaxID=2527994 RepID=A0A517QPJ0_9PLAN|nr:3-hydroxyacyl-[acyl-carrier-protein] dehydratase FabZ [Thalassoglobus polymorphus]
MEVFPPLGQDVLFFWIPIIVKQQMRFSLIDQITELKAGESITAAKNLTLAEEYLQDHFPGFPVMPGVLMVEALVQTSAWLMRYSEDFRYSTVLLDEAKAVKFNSFVKPGDTITIQSKLQKKNDESTWTFKASGNVGETNVITAKLILKQFNLADEYPSIASGDAVQTESIKTLFNVLYPQAESAKS